MNISVHPRSFTVEFEEEQKVIITNVKVSSPQETSLAAMAEARAIWDTGAEMCMITEKFAEQMGLPVLGRINVRGVNHETSTDLCLADIQLPNGMILPSVSIAKCEILPPADCSVIIGMSVIKSSDFSISHKNGQTLFSFRKPSMKRTDYVRVEERRDKWLLILRRLKGFRRNR